MPRKVLSFVLNDFSHDIRVLKEAKSLQSSGYEVIVLALGDPNVSLPRQVNGLPVERLNLKLKNILPAKLFFQVLKYGEIIVKSLPHCLNADIVHCHDFEPLPIAILAKGLRFGRLKIVYDAHELEVERVPKAHPLKKKVFKFFEDLAISFCDAMITVNKSIAEIYHQRTGVQPVQILNCPNYVQLNPQKYWHSLFHLSPQQKVFIYQGLFSKGRGLEDLINAFSQLSENYVLVLMGKGPLEAFLRGKAEKLPNVFIHNFTAAQDMLNYTASADFGIVPTELIGLNNTLSLPNKYFEYLMAGLPLICIDSPEMGYFIKKFQCGTTFSKNSPEDILNSIERIVTEDYSQLKNRALDVAKNYCWETQEPKLLEIYENL